MRSVQLGTSFAVLFLAAAGVGTAQVTINSVVNAASRIQSSSQSYGLAQGSLFAILGKGVGPDQLQQASFPLPTTDGLAGVTVQASVADTTVDCILVFVSPTEVDAILPSATPIGAGTITLSNNGVTASKPITVVASAFGIFRHRTAGLTGQALAFNVSPDDGSTLGNGNAQSALPGQDVLINGTGLGAISSDETQSGVTDIPTSAIQVYVGIVPAVVVSAGRGACCDGIDPDFPVPQGIAAWDVIRFTIPDGIVGCFIPVAVQIGTFVSNLATISIDPSGAACALQVSPLPTAQSPDGNGGPSVGEIGLGRSSGMTARANGTIATTKIDSGNASFMRFDNLPAGVTIAADILYPTNVCSINGFPGPDGMNTANGAPVTIVPITSTPLDAGPSIKVQGPSGERTINRQVVANLVVYTAPNFGNGTPGNYYDPGHYTVTGVGGPNVGQITTSVDVPATPFEWANIPDPKSSIDRSQDLTVTWTGGYPGTQVTIVGGSLVNGVNVGFLCAAPVEAGQMTVPSFVLENLPPTGSSAVPGQLTMLNRLVTVFRVSGLDLASVRYAVAHTVYLKFQ